MRTRFLHNLFVWNVILFISISTHAHEQHQLSAHLLPCVCVSVIKWKTEMRIRERPHPAFVITNRSARTPTRYWIISALPHRSHKSCTNPPLVCAIHPVSLNALSFDCVGGELGELGCGWVRTGTGCRSPEPAPPAYVRTVLCSLWLIYFWIHQCSYLFTSSSSSRSGAPLTWVSLASGIRTSPRANVVHIIKYHCVRSTLSLASPLPPPLTPPSPLAGRRTHALAHSRWEIHSRGNFTD